MNADVAASLQSIQSSLHVLIAIIAIGVAVAVVRLWLATKTAIRQSRDEVLNLVAMEDYDKGEFERLVAYCKDDLIRFPNRALALWHLARAQYALKDYEQAKQTLDRLLESEPTWVDSHIKPMLDRIEALRR